MLDLRNKDKETDRIIDFLLAEYNTMNDERKRLSDEGVSRLNFLVTLMSSVLGGLVVVSGFGTISGDQLQLISILAILFLLLPAWMTFRFSVDRAINIDIQLRGMARIRQYFVNLSPAIRKHLTWPDDDLPTRYVTGHTSTVRTTSQVIVSILCAASSGTLSYLLGKQALISTIAILIAFVLVFVLLDIYIAKRLGNAQKLAIKDSRFTVEAEE